MKLLKELLYLIFFLLFITPKHYKLLEIKKSNYFPVGSSKMMWCGDRECEDEIKKLTNATARCLPFNQIPFDDKCPCCGKKASKVVLFAKAY